MLHFFLKKNKIHYLNTCHSLVYIDSLLELMLIAGNKNHEGKGGLQ
jgi:hypothetical protein